MEPAMTRIYLRSRLTAMIVALRGRGIPGAALLIAACANEPVAPSLPVAPAVEATAAEATPYNAISATVSVHVRNADSVAVRFRLDDVPSGGDSLSPAVKTPVGSAATAVVSVLGLLPERRYIIRAVAYGPGGNVEGDAVEFTTGPLPSDLPQYSASGSD